MHYINVQLFCLHQLIPLTLQVRMPSYYTSTVLPLLKWNVRLRMSVFSYIPFHKDNAATTVLYIQHRAVRLLLCQPSLYKNRKIVIVYYEFVSYTYREMRQCLFCWFFFYYSAISFSFLLTP
jgi:hypothetical protein